MPYNKLFDLYDESVLKKDLKEVNVVTMLCDPIFLEHLVRKKSNTKINLYHFDNDNIDTLTNLEKKYNNLNVEYILDNHIKGIIAKDAENNISLISTSANFTKGGLIKNIELFFYNYYTPIDIDMKFGEGSFIQGWVDFVETELNINILDDEISENSVNFLDAKSYGREIKKGIRKISKKENNLSVCFTTPEVKSSFVLNLFERCNDAIESMEIVTNKIQDNKKLMQEFKNLNVITPDQKIHAKTFCVFGEENYFVGFGTSNLTFTGLGFSNKYPVKKEINFCFKGKIRDLDVYSSKLKCDKNAIYRFLNRFTFSDSKLRKYLKERNINNKKMGIKEIVNIAKMVESINNEDIINKSYLVGKVIKFQSTLGANVPKYFDKI